MTTKYQLTLIAPNLLNYCPAKWMTPICYSLEAMHNWGTIGTIYCKCQLVLSDFNTEPDYTSCSSKDASCDCLHLGLCK